MENNEHISHDNPGFGKNTNGMGILIIAVVFVAITLAAFYFWKSGSAEYDHYRIEKKEAANHEGHEGEAAAEH